MLLQEQGWGSSHSLCVYGITLLSTVTDTWACLDLCPRLLCFKIWCICNHLHSLHLSAEIAAVDPSILETLSWVTSQFSIHLLESAEVYIYFFAFLNKSIYEFSTVTKDSPSLNPQLGCSSELLSYTGSCLTFPLGCFKGTAYSARWSQDPGADMIFSCHLPNSVVTASKTPAN